MPTFDYRVTRTVYHNRIVHEDGPGSLQNIAADVSKPRTIAMWKGKNDDFGNALLKGGHSLQLDEDSEGGFVEYSYRLECR